MNCLLVPLICFRLMRKLERLGILGAVGMQCISLLPVLLTSQPSHSILCRYDPVELDPEEMCKMAKEQPQVVKCLLTTGNAIFSQIVPNTFIHFMAQISNWLYNGHLENRRPVTEFDPVKVKQTLPVQSVMLPLIPHEMKQLDRSVTDYNRSKKRKRSIWGPLSTS